MDFIKKNKTIAIVLGVVVLVLVGFMVMSMGKKPVEPTEITAEEESMAPIPTVSDSVKVAFEVIENGREIEITVTNAPEGTSDIEAEITYDRTNPETGEGVVGDGGFPDIKKEGNVWKGGAKLGTCSATCTYHTVVSEDIKLVLKFTGSYGEQIFEKAFPYSKE